MTRAQWGTAVVSLLLLASGLVLAIGLWILLPILTAPDMAEPLQLNSLGVGYMEQYNYPAAEKEFRRVVEKAPRWTPGQINLAIALLNQNTPESLAESVQILEHLLKKYPDNPHAHYSLAIILNQSGDTRAAEHFEAVTRIDPSDPHAWYYLGKCRELDDPAAASLLLEKAAALSPYLSSAIYSMAQQKIRAGDREGGRRLLKKHQELSAASQDEKAEIKYGMMGRYADVIGREPRPVSFATGPLPLFEPADLQVRLNEGTRWATGSDFLGDPISELRGRVARRFGITAATLDYDGDEQTDILLLGAVVRDGSLGDLLLRNEGGWRFSEVTRSAGLAGPQPSLGCAVGDFDNDGQPDLFITGVGANRLYRNVGGKFADVSQSAGITGPPRISLGAAFLDLDFDGDLDVYVTNYTDVDQAALAFTQSPPRAVPNVVYQNVGAARAVDGSEVDQSGGAPLEASFRAIEGLEALVHGELSVAVTTGDFDNDRDLDLCLIQDANPAMLILNDRLMQFHRQSIPLDVLPAGGYTGAVAADFDKNGNTDLWIVNPTGPSRLLLNQTARGSEIQFRSGVTNVEQMRQGRLTDIDLDGWFDVAGSTALHPVLAHNRADRLERAFDVFGLDIPNPVGGAARRSAPASDSSSGSDPAWAPWAAVISDLDGDGPADLFQAGAATTRALRNMGNGHHWVKLKLTGVRNIGQEMRTTRDAVAARFILHAADLWVEAEQGSQTAGIGQAYEPILVGLGTRDALDVVRVRWPDGTLQGEFVNSVDGLVQVGQQQRKPISCPLLFVWNGSRFEYVADFLGGGGLGYLLAPGVYNLPDRDEAVKIEPGRLVPQDGYYLIKIAEPMDEVTYLDHVRLTVVDHPEAVSVYPEERFAPPGSRPEWRLLSFREPILPVRAIDSSGKDVTEALRAWDRNAVDSFRLLGAWIGYAEAHTLTLDFGDRLARFGPTDPLILYLAGWVEYPFSETNYAAATAGVKLQPPTLERLGDDGRWHSIEGALGHPAGSPKMMSLDLTGKLVGPRCVLRLRSNMQVYWDQIFAAPLEEPALLRVQELPIVDARLGYRGHLLEYSPDGRGPTLHDYHRVDAVPLVRQAGHYTRFGDVRELLNEDDDRFVIFGAGDELDVEFDESTLPVIAPGWKRSFVLRTWGYCKSADVLTAHPDTVEPLPFRGMSGYPFPSGEAPANPAAQLEYIRTFNTRIAQP